MTDLVINCRRTPFGSTLGVAHLLLHLVRELQDRHRLVFVVDAKSDVDNTPAAETIRACGDVVTFDEARIRADLRAAVEFLPHHFQPREIADRSIVICHDLHVFDLPDKYGAGASRMQEGFRRNLRQADAVFAHFPRTFTDVERVAGVALPSLFLMDAPLLFDTAAALGPARVDRSATRLLYPAQLQTHKNHLALIESIARVRTTGRDVRLRCPGSDFDEELTSVLSGAVERAELKGVVEFLGRIDEAALLDEYRSCDAVVVPSAAEGGAYVALEGVMAGKPVAVNGIRSARMHVEQVGADVHWFDSEDPDALDAAIEHLADVDQEQLSQANESCRARLAATSWSQPAELISDVVASIMAGQRPPMLRTNRTFSSIDYFPATGGFRV